MAEPLWDAELSYKNPPGEYFTEGDPLGRFKLPRRRVWGFAVWNVVVQHPYRDMHTSRGVRHMERGKFKYVILGVLLVMLVMSLILLRNLGLL